MILHTRISGYYILSHEGLPAVIPPRVDYPSPGVEFCRFKPPQWDNGGFSPASAFTSLWQVDHDILLLTDYISAR
jgi:hypothetical protein